MPFSSPSKSRILGWPGYFDSWQELDTIKMAMRILGNLVFIVSVLFSSVFTFHRVTGNISLDALDSTMPQLFSCEPYPDAAVIPVHCPGGDTDLNPFQSLYLAVQFKGCRI